MQHAFLFLFVLVSSGAAWAQQGFVRANLNPNLKPFYHGVASGDPLSDRVMIWTRVTPDDTDPTSIAVDWEVATDTTFGTIVVNGSTTTTGARDWTVKVDVTGLSADTWYYYRFTTNASGSPEVSQIGRTRTLPAPGSSPSRFRMAVASCQDYANGYYGAWEGLANENDVDLVLFLGDYIYEYGGGEGDFANVPDREIVSASDYRARYGQYRLDPDLQYAHQQFPFINVWDDHESTNNSWRDGAENHDPGEGVWQERLDTAIQVFYEWLPIRPVDSTNLKRIYRTFPVGDLIDIIMLDTRIIGRDEQGSGDDATREMLGDQQFEFVTGALKNSTAKWKLLGQQVMFSYLVGEVNIPIVGPIDVSINNDQWDGYPNDRARLLDTLETYDIDNTVVLTGDIHTSWAMDIPVDQSTYNGTTGAGSRAVEFVCKSITSANAGAAGPLGDILDFEILGFGLLDLLNLFAPHIKYFDLNDHGYYILDVDQNRAQADFFTVGSITERSQPMTWTEGWFTNDGDNHISSATAAVASPAPIAVPAPRPPLFLGEDPDTATARSPLTPALLGVYPNPFGTQVEVQFLNYQTGEGVFHVLDVQGREVFRRETIVETGLNVKFLHLGNLPAGVYLLRIETPTGSLLRRIVKQ